jgi:anti-sigma B factor antagonist
MIDFNHHRTEAGTLVFRMNGHLDEQSIDYFFKCVSDAIEDGNKKIVISFAGVGRISSVGLGALVRASSRASKAGGTIFLATVESQILNIFQLVRFDKLFNIYETEAQAIAEIES